jgi:hypothetical protein
MFRFLLAVMVAGSALAGGTVRGSVVDPGIYPLPKAIVRLLPQDSRVTKYRVEADQGKFTIEDVSAGVYILRAHFAGFRESAVTITVREGEVTDVGNVVLPFEGCDLSICDSVGPPERPNELARGDAIVGIDCGVDLDKVAVNCRGDNRADLRLERQSGGAIYLKAVGRAKISDCETRKSIDQPVRLDGLGPGNDWCVETNGKHHAHVFVELKVVEPGADEVALWVVTRK